MSRKWTLLSRWKKKPATWAKAGKRRAWIVTGKKQDRVPATPPSSQLPYAACPISSVFRCSCVRIDLCFWRLGWLYLARLKCLVAAAFWNPKCSGIGTEALRTCNRLKIVAMGWWRGRNNLLPLYTRNLPYNLNAQDAHPSQNTRTFLALNFLSLSLSLSRAPSHTHARPHAHTHATLHSDHLHPATPITTATC